MKRLLFGLSLFLCACKPNEPAAPHITRFAEPPVLQARTPCLALSLSLEGHARIGQNVFFKVRIKNISDREVDGVLSLDGSDAGMRFPKFHARLTGPDNKPTWAKDGRCGNCNGLRQADIVALKPGEEFDPLGDPSFLGHVYLAGWVPATVGKHRLSLLVDYSATDPAEWNGDEERLTANGERVRSLLSRVPRERMEATLEFDVIK